jgi:CubicO group peptidase (beta-lactamase class C family)
MPNHTMTFIEPARHAARALSVAIALAAYSTVALPQVALQTASSSAGATSCTSVPITFRLSAQGITEGQAVHVVGDQGPLSNWTATPENRLSNASAELLQVTLEFPPVTPLQFKFMRSGAAGELWESDRTSYRNPNRTLVTPACGQAALVVDGGRLERHASVLEAEMTGRAFRDEPLQPADTRSTHIKALIEAFNAKDAGAVQRFIERHTTLEFQRSVSMQEHQEAFGDYRFQMHAVELRGLRQYEPGTKTTAVLVRGRALDKPGLIALSFQPGAEALIDGIQFVPGMVPVRDSAARKDKLTPAAFRQEARRLVDNACRQGAFSGAILIAQNGRPLLQKACGEASRRYHVLNRIDTKFNLGSMNKMFTAVAVAQLAERGALSLDDRISRFVDESWLPKSVTESITIRHLLTHTSGLGSYFSERFFKSSRDQFRELDDYRPLVADDKPAFTPGERPQYSNTGFLLLGVVIEQASGMSYFDYVRRNIFVPSGMTQTDSYAMDDPVENLATGYYRAQGSPFGVRENNLLHVLRGGPAGGGYSNVGDLIRFATALQGGRLLKPASAEALWQQGMGPNYGLGFELKQGDAGRVAGHSGGFPGLNGQLDIYRDRGIQVAALSNDDGTASMLANRLSALVARLMVR